MLLASKKCFASSKLHSWACPASPCHVALYLQHLIDESHLPCVVDSAVYGIKWAPTTFRDTSFERIRGVVRLHKFSALFCETFQRSYCNYSARIIHNHFNDMAFGHHCLRCPQRRTLFSSKTFLLRLDSFPTDIYICCLVLKLTLAFWWSFMREVWEVSFYNSKTDLRRIWEDWQKRCCLHLWLPCFPDFLYSLVTI